jgi:hypothetical protein
LQEFFLAGVRAADADDAGGRRQVIGDVAGIHRGQQFAHRQIAAAAKQNQIKIGKSHSMNFVAKKCRRNCRAQHAAATVNLLLIGVVGKKIYYISPMAGAVVAPRARLRKQFPSENCAIMTVFLHAICSPFRARMRGLRRIT